MTVHFFNDRSNQVVFRFAGNFCQIFSAVCSPYCLCCSISVRLSPSCRMLSGRWKSWMSGTSRPSTDWVAVICSTHDERGKTSDHGIPLPSLPALLTALRQSPFSRSLLATCQRFYLEVVWRNEQILFRSFSGGRIAGLRNAVPGGRIHPSATTCPCGG